MMFDIPPILLLDGLGRMAIMFRELLSEFFV